MDERPSPLPRLVWGIVAVIGGLLGATLLTAILVILYFTWIGEVGTEEAFILLSPMEGALALTTAMTVVALRAIAGKGGKPLRVRRGDWLLLLLWLALFLATLFIQTESLLVSLLNIAAFALPPLVILLFLIRLSGAEAAPTQRQFWVSLWMGMVAILPAILLELLAAVVGALAFLLLTRLSASAAAYLRQLQQLFALLRKSGLEALSTLDEGTLLRLFASPYLYLYLLFIAALVAPLAEEGGKTLWLALAGRWLPRRPATFFLLGAASGVAFAFFESLNNSTSPAGNVLGWGTDVLIRLMPAMMHTVASGMGGLGWGYIWSGRRGRGAIFVALGIFYHAMWNGSLITTVWGGLQVALSALGGSIEAAPLTLGLTAGVPAVAIMGLMWLSAPILLVVLPLWLRRATHR